MYMCTCILGVLALQTVIKLISGLMSVQWSVDVNLRADSIGYVFDLSLGLCVYGVPVWLDSRLSHS